MSRAQNWIRSVGSANWVLQTLYWTGTGFNELENSTGLASFRKSLRVDFCLLWDYLIPLMY